MSKSKGSSDRDAWRYHPGPVQRSTLEHVLGFFDAHAHVGERR